MKHLVELYDKSDDIDRSEGRAAYERYHRMMKKIAKRYGFPFGVTTAAFAAMSPNSDYLGNLRSLISVMEGLRQGKRSEEIKVSTYNHCRDRAIGYIVGRERFLDHAKGLKTRAFYLNILNPEEPFPVTVDGHMFCAWKGEDMPMQAVRMSDRCYGEIADDIRMLARCLGLIPNQLQATLWFARKRIKRIVFDSQLDFWMDPSRTELDLDQIRPYT